jgi:hypothetical protein
MTAVYWIVTLRISGDSADCGDWRTGIFDAQGYSNKRDAIRDAKRVRADQVVELGAFGARLCFNRVIQIVWRTGR